MPSAINKLMVTELAKRLHDMSHAVLVDHTGLSAQQADTLRAKLGEQGAHMIVVRNSLVVLALRQLELLDVAELVDGPTAFIFGGDDPVALAKMVLAWSKAEKVLEVRGGMVEGRAVDANGVRALAALPPVDVLRAQLAGALAAPMSAFVGTLGAVMRDFVGVLNARTDQQGESQD
ncbi:50S ribosomal protein L10 [Planctomycetota bacterium]